MTEDNGIVMDISLANLQPGVDDAVTSVVAASDTMVEVETEFLANLERRTRMSAGQP